MNEPGIAVRRQPHHHHQQQQQQQQQQQAQQQQHLQTPPSSKAFGSSGMSRLIRESSGECVSSSEDEHLTGETHFEARVSVHSRKKSSKGQQVNFDQDPADRVLQLQGDQLKLKKKDKLKAKIFIYYVWVRRNVSDYVPSDSHRIKDESLAVLAGWYKDLMIVTFSTSGEKELFLQAFKKINLETLRGLYGEESEPSEQCQVSLGSCVQIYVDPPSPSSGTDAASPGAPAAVQTLTVKHYETANDVVRKCKVAFKLDPGYRAQLYLEDSTSHCMVGCESIFATVLYHIHDQRRERRRGSALSEASSTSPNESNSMDLDVEQIATRIRLSLHSKDTCSAGVCSTTKKKKQQQQQQQQQQQPQSRRASEMPSRIRNWISSNRRSQLSRQGSVEALAASGGGSSSGGGVGASNEPSPVIGRPLAELFPSGVVSRPVTCLLAHIYHRCHSIRGIFRQPGSVSEKNQVLQLLSQYDLTKSDNLPQLNKFGEHCIADALKHYLRTLPGCLLQRNLFDQWSSIGRDVVEEVISPQTAAVKIRHVVQQMHKQNAHLLHMLMTALRRVANNHEQNQMTPGNIGRSVSFSVLEQDPQCVNLATMEQEAQRINKLIELMIANFDDIWPNERENARVLNEFVTHICPTDDHLSSMESLTAVDGVRPPTDAAEPLSLSSLSKDSGLQLSDQQLDDNRRSAAAVSATIDIPERQQPPPYDIAMKRQAQTQRSRPQQQQQKPRKPPPPQLPYQEVTATAVTTPRRERPPVPARMNRRPASVGPGGSGGSSGRQPLPPGFDPLAESKSRHPLVTSASVATQSAALSTATTSSSSRPVRAAPAASSASVAAAATAAAQRLHPMQQQQQQQQLTQLQLQQSRFRKRSSSETRLELIGLDASGRQQSQPQVGPTRHRHQHQHQHQHRHQTDSDEATRHRRQEFERLSRFHLRDSFDSSTIGGGGRQSRQFSSRHTPMRGPAPGEAMGSPRQHQHQPQPRPRTKLPEQLELRLANQPESLV